MNFLTLCMVFTLLSCTVLAAPKRGSNAIQAQNCTTSLRATQSQAASGSSNSKPSTTVISVKASNTGSIGSNSSNAEALDFGSCVDPGIEFGRDFDGRTEDSFRPANKTEFKHGSAQKIGVIAGFICNRLKDTCKASEKAIAACSAAQAASGVLQGQAAADAWNDALGLDDDLIGGEVASNAAAASSTSESMPAPFGNSTAAISFSNSTSTLRSVAAKATLDGSKVQITGSNANSPTAASTSVRADVSDSSKGPSGQSKGHKNGDASSSSTNFVNDDNSTLKTTQGGQASDDSSLSRVNPNSGKGASSVEKGSQNQEDDASSTTISKVQVSSPTRTATSSSQSSSSTSIITAGQTSSNVESGSTKAGDNQKGNDNKVDKGKQKDREKESNKALGSEKESDIHNNGSIKGVSNGNKFNSFKNESSIALQSSNTTKQTNTTDSALTLLDSLIQKASASDGLATGEANQSPSATDPANFINFCRGKTLTNGIQQNGTSCNGIVMGEIPAQTAMLSQIITFPGPAKSSNLKADTTFEIKVQIKNLETGSFTNPDTTYYSAPQTLSNGVVLGHSHITVQDLGSSLAPQKPPSATTFVFFKGLNVKADGDGGLSATVKGGLPAGNFRVCTMGSASNHQPALMPVAQRGAQDDCQKFSIL